MTAGKKIKNWEELINDGENYGDAEGQFSAIEKIIFESIKDKKLLKIQDSYAFSKTGHQKNSDHGKQLAELIANFEPLKEITSLIITHNDLGPEGIKVLAGSRVLPKVEYLHLGSNNLGNEGTKILAQSELFSQVKTLNLECNGITEVSMVDILWMPGQRRMQYKWQLMRVELSHMFLMIGRSKKFHFYQPL